MRFIQIEEEEEDGLSILCSSTVASSQPSQKLKMLDLELKYRGIKHHIYI